MKRLVVAVLLVVAVAWLTESWWYAPVVRAVPAAGLFLPQPSSYTPASVTLAPTPAAPIVIVTAPPVASSPATPAPQPSPAAVVDDSQLPPATAAMAATVLPPLSDLAYAIDVPGRPWNAVEANWAIDTLYVDYQLDRASGDSGGVNIGKTLFYWNASDEWSFCFSLALGEGSNPPATPSSAAAATCIRDFQTALAGHQAALATNGASDVWDEEWGQAYSALILLFGEFVQ